MSQDDKKSAIKSFRQQLDAFTKKVHELSTNASLSTEAEFLQKVAEDVHRLYTCSIEVQKDTDEDVEEIGALIQNLFVQPLSIKDHRRVTILKAVESFENGRDQESDLSHIMREYVKHPESTKSFIRELELLAGDLDEVLGKIA